MNILYVFTLDNPLKLSIDGEKKALCIYHNIALKYQNVWHWLKMLDKTKGAAAFELVDIPKGRYSHVNLFLTICENTEGDKVLLCKSKQDYKDTDWQSRGIELLNKDESKEHLKGELVRLGGQSGDTYQNIKDSLIMSRSGIAR